MDLGAGKIAGDFMSVIPPGAVGGIFVVAKPWAEANKDA